MGKKMAASKQVGPTEVQVRHAEIVKKARAEQAAQASLAAQAKAAKTPATSGLAASMPILTPAEILLNQIAGPSPIIPVPAPIEPIADVQPGADDATDEDVEITGQRALTPDPDRPTGTNPHLTKEQKASAIDLNFAWVLSDDPRKALQIARNTSEVNQALKAMRELEMVIKSKCFKLTTKKPLSLHIQAKKQALAGQEVEAEELPDIEVPPPRATRFPPPSPQRTQGFVPSSSRSTARGKPAASGTGGRGGRRSRGGRGTASTSRRSDTFDLTLNNEVAEEETIGQSLPKLAQVRKAIEIHTNKQGLEPNGEVEKLNQFIADADARAPEPEEAKDYTLADMMPADQRHETDHNPDMIANVADKHQCVDFILMMDVRIVMANGKVKGMTLPNRQT